MKQITFSILQLKCRKITAQLSSMVLRPFVSGEVRIKDQRSHCFQAGIAGVSMSEDLEIIIETCWLAEKRIHLGLFRHQMANSSAVVTKQKDVCWKLQDVPMGYKLGVLPQVVTYIGPSEIVLFTSATEKVRFFMSGHQNCIRGLLSKQLAQEQTELSNAKGRLVVRG